MYSIGWSIDRILPFLPVDLILQINSAFIITARRESVLYLQSIFQSHFDLFCSFKMNFIPLIAHCTLAILPASLHFNTSIAQHDWFSIWPYFYMDEEEWAHFRSNSACLHGMSCDKCFWAQTRWWLYRPYRMHHADRIYSVWLSLGFWRSLRVTIKQGQSLPCPSHTIRRVLIHSLVF